MEKQNGQHHGENRGELVYGSHPVDIRHLQRLEVAEPGSPGGHSRENQQNPCLPVDAADLPCGALRRNDAPAEEKDHDGPQRRGHIGVHLLQTRFRYHAGGTRKNRGQYRQPHPMYIKP